jgi:hypothetical protein
MQTIEINALPNTDYNTVYSYKGRTINLEKPIKVYKNLHKDCYSIKQGILVVAHAERVCLKDVTFEVNEKNRQKVIKTKQKNVHAFIKGFYDTYESERKDLSVEVYYNPYKTESFINKQTNRPLIEARFVIADKNGVRAS